MPARKKQQYNEGDVFVVTLRDGRFARGAVARIGRRGVTLGYFFGPAVGSSAELPDSSHLQASDAIYVCRFGDLRIINGTWIKNSTIDPWDRNQWPVPMFCRHGNSLITYDETLAEISAQPAARGDCARYEEDGLAGAGFVEIRLTRLLASAQHGTVNASARPDPNAARLVLEQDFIQVAEVELGNYRLRLAAGATGVDDVIADLGHEPNGAFWQGIVEILVITELPQYDGRFESDAEANAYFAYSEQRDVVDGLATQLRAAATDGDRIRQLVILASDRGFKFDD